MQTTLFSNFLKTIFVLFLFFAFTKTSFSQEGKTKAHYVVNNAADAKETVSYTELLSQFNFEQYRFYDKRRTIKFINNNITVDLFSAKELLEVYGKPISPLTIMDNIPKKDIAFLLNGGKVQIVTVKK